ncbi:MAG: 30S ribosomal protein S20 [Chloroflexi bacterium]|nr:MAG: 30S ribosomal protein S20 [Chloroflexota bacterium]
MANTRSAQKAMRQAERRAVRNQAARSAVRTFVKKAAEAVTATAHDASQVVRDAVRALDKAAQKGIVHRNAAARRKSRLMARLHQATNVAQTQAAEPEAKAKTPARRGSTATTRSATAAAKPAARKPATSTRKPKE